HCRRCVPAPGAVRADALLTNQTDSLDDVKSIRVRHLASGRRASEAVDEVDHVRAGRFVDPLRRSQCVEHRRENEARTGRSGAITEDDGVAPPEVDRRGKWARRYKAPIDWGRAH